jgi:hypothetical protein
MEVISVRGPITNTDPGQAHRMIAAGVDDSMSSLFPTKAGQTPYANLYYL